MQEILEIFNGIVNDPKLKCFHFEVFTKPVSKARARAGRGHFYADQKTREYENLLAWQFQNAKLKNGYPLDKNGPIYLFGLFETTPPKSWSKKRKAQALAGEIKSTSRPDADNYAKAVLDALNGIAYTDDAQVTIQFAAKRYAERDRVSVHLVQGDFIPK